MLKNYLKKNLTLILVLAQKIKIKKNGLKIL